MQKLAVFSVTLALLGGCSSSNSSTQDSIVPKVQNSSSSVSTEENVDDNADPREKVVAESIAALLEQEHVRDQPIDDNLSKKAFASYLESLDSGKVFLIQSDVEALREFELSMDDELLSGNLKLAHEAERRLLQQYKVVQGIVAKKLETPFNYKLDESIETDGEKLVWAKDISELEERWRKELKFEVLGRISRMESREEQKNKLKSEPKKTKDEESEDAEVETRASRAPIPKTFEGKEAKARKDLAKSYDARFNRLLDTEPLDSVASFINAVTGEYDPHTMYMPPADEETFDIQMSGSLEGIGAVLSEDEHYIRVVEVVPGGPSWTQGDLEAGDLILAVEQQGAESIDIVDMRIDKVVQMIRGKKGTIVTLTTEKSDGSVKMIKIKRDVVSIEASYARAAIINTPKMAAKIGYLYLPSFYGSTRGPVANQRRAATDVAVIMNMFSKKKVAGAILDMRGNGGGFLDDAKVMTGLFIEEGPVVQTGTPSQVTEILEDKDKDIVFDAPLVILVDRFSASASEIVAGALQDYGRAVVVGAASTHGKGTVQAVVKLERFAQSPNGKPLGVLKITVQQFFRINGESTQWKGVEPDVELVDGAAHLKSGERHLDNSLPWATVAPLNFKKWNKKSWNTSKMTQASAARQAKSPYFKLIKSRSEILQQRRERSLFPISYKGYSTLLKKERKEIEKLDPETELKNRKRIKVDIVDYDGSMAKFDSKREGRKTGRSPQGWAKGLASDAVVEEGLHVLRDMGVR